MTADGFEKAIIGVGRRVGEQPITVYDRTKCIRILMDRDGMTGEEAEEYLEFNVEGAWLGDQTPLFVDLEEPTDERSGPDEAAVRDGTAGTARA